MLRKALRMADTRFTRVAGIVLFVLVAVVYATSLKNGFLNYDDNILVTTNPAISSQSWQAFRFIFATFDPELYIPLTFLSYKIDFLLGGIQPFVFHLTNVLLHAFNSLLVALVLRKLLRGRTWVALACGAIFAVHPLNTEAVAWISARKDLLSASFCLLSLLGYLRYCETHDRRKYWFAVACFGLGLLAKVSIVTLPLALLCMEWRIGTLRRKGVPRDMVPFALLAAIFVAVAIAGKAGNVGGSHLWEIVLLAPKSMVFLLTKFVVPLGLSVVYPFTGPVSLSNADIAGPLLAVLVAVAVLAGTRRRFRDIVFGLSFFLIMLAPSFAGAEHNGDLYIASDRYAYLPMVGLLFLAGWLLNRFAERSHRPVPWAILATAIVGLFAPMAYARSLTWHDSRTLFEDVLRTTDQSHVAYTKVGGELFNEGDFERAREYFERSLAIRRNEQALYNMGLLYLRAARNAEALQLNEEAIAINPRYAPAYVNAGYLRYEQGDVATAVQYFERAIQLDSRGAEQRLNLASILASQGDLERARKLVNDVLALDPANAEALALQAQLQ